MNINEYVWVKLNDKGRAHHQDWHERTLGEFASRFPYSSPIEDEAGWSKWQLWDLMQTFGPIIRLGDAAPFDCEISLTKPEK